MSDHGTLEYATAEGNDYEQHLRSYELFISLTKWCTISIVVLMVLMWIFLL